jgi:ribosome-associated protein
MIAIEAQPPPMRPPAPDDDADAAPAAAGQPPRPSKTQLKRQMHDLQRLGERLVRLSPVQLARIELPEPLREQIELARRITAREALRRQLQYIGRLMRKADAEAIGAALADLNGGPARTGPAP